VLMGLSNGRIRARTMADIIRRHWANDLYIEDKHGKAVFSVLQMFLRQLDAENVVWMQQIGNMASKNRNINLRVGQFLGIMTDYFEEEFRTSEKAITLLAFKQPVYRKIFMNKTSNTVDMDKMNDHFSSRHTYDVLLGYVDETQLNRIQMIEDHLQKVREYREGKGYIKKEKEPIVNTEVEKEPKPNTAISVKEDPEVKEVGEELAIVEKEYEELPANLIVDYDRDHNFFKSNAMENQEFDVASLRTPHDDPMFGDNNNNSISSNSKQLNSWEIALISVGSVAFLFALCFFTYVCVRKFCIRNNNSHKTSKHNGVKGVDVESFGHERIVDSNLGGNNLVDVALSNQPVSSHKYSVFTSV